MNVCKTEGCNEVRVNGARCLEHRREKAREYYEANKEKALAGSRAWAEKNQDKVAVYRREYYESNKEQILAGQKEYRAQNPERITEAQRAWRANNEGHVYETANGYSRYIGFEHPISNPSGVTPYHRIVLWDKLNGQDAMCHWGCGKKVYWSKKHPFDSDALCVDHVDTNKKNNHPDNLVPSCHNCNLTREGGRSARPGPEKTQVGECIVSFCDRPQKAKHLCAAHFQQQRAGKEFTPVRKHVRSEVTVDEFGKTCTDCNEHKTFDKFYKRKNGSAKSVCRDCEIKRSKRAKAAMLAKGIPCSVDGCERASLTKGYCSLHYHRLVTTGELGPVGIKNNNNNTKESN